MQSDIRLVLFLEKKTISVKIKLRQFSKNVSRNEGENFCHYFSFYDFAKTAFMFLLFTNRDVIYLLSICSSQLCMKWLFFANAARRLDYYFFEVKFLHTYTICMVWSIGVGKRGERE